MNVRASIITRAVVSIFILTTSVIGQSGEGLRAFTGAKILLPDGSVLERGTMIIDGSRIVTVGADVSVPSGVPVEDLEGKWIYPGMIDMGNNIGLSEIGSVRGSLDTNEKGLTNPHVDVISAVNPHSEHFAVARANGVLFSLTSPQGELLAGKPALISHAGKTGREMAVAETTGVLLQFPRIRRKDFTEESATSIGKTRDDALKRLNAYFDLARRYGAEKAEALKQGKLESIEVDLGLDAMAPILDRSLPLIVVANDVDTIVAAVEWSKQQNVKIILRGCRDAWMVAKYLGLEKIDCILDATFAQPGDDQVYDVNFAAAGELARHGVRFAFATGSSSDSRNLPYHAAMSVSFGLDRQAALRALTSNAASILGVADLVGELKPGAKATFFVSDGDILDLRTKVERVFMKGVDVGIASRHTRLRDEFTEPEVEKP